jgi:hypothetical protein
MFRPTFVLTSPLTRAGTIQHLTDPIRIMIPQARYDTYRDTFSDGKPVKKESKT